VEGKAQLFTKLLGDANLKGQIELSKNELHQKYLNIDKSQIDRYMAWVSCQNIFYDKTLTTPEKTELLIKVYHELVPSGDHHSEMPTNDQKTDLYLAMQKVFDDSALTLKLADFPSATRDVDTFLSSFYVIHQEVAYKFAGENETYTRSIYWKPDGRVSQVWYHYRPPWGGRPFGGPKPECQNTQLRKKYFALVQALRITPTVTRNDEFKYYRYQATLNDPTYKDTYLQFEQNWGCGEDITILIQPQKL
jgi:hypothetical protein